MFVTAATCGLQPASDSTREADVSGSHSGPWYAGEELQLEGPGRPPARRAPEALGERLADVAAHPGAQPAASSMRPTSAVVVVLPADPVMPTTGAAHLVKRRGSLKGQPRSRAARTTAPWGTRAEKRTSSPSRSAAPRREPAPEFGERRHALPGAARG